MTHDELLDEIGELMPNPSTIDYKTWAALRAVVELHKPDDEGDCIPCRPDLAYRSYPCLTIQAIEKELK